MDTSSLLSSLAGGVIIGAAAALLLLANGRVAGISGIVGGLLNLQRGDLGWRTAFLLGLFLAPAAYVMLGGDLFPIRIDASTGQLAAAGLLVGFGARLGSGCTSGHGVCGIGRGSVRAIAATLVFMAAGIITVFVTQHLLRA